MELQAFGSIDITPRTTGILDLWSISDDGIYEIREYLCGSDTYKLLFRGNYTDIPIVISVNTCIKIANILNQATHVYHRWTYGGGINTLLITTAVLYAILIAIIGILICIGCGFGGKIARWIYDNKIAHIFVRDTCVVPPMCDPIADIDATQISDSSSRYNNKPLPLPPTNCTFIQKEPC